MKITFIAHSAFLVEWDKFYTLFDYVYEPDYTCTLPPLDPQKPLLVFSSHSHEDHFDGKVFGLLEKYPLTQFFVSRDTRLTERRRKWLGISDEAFARTTVLRPDSILLTEAAGEELSVRAIKSTDIGNAYLLRAEGKMVYHGGDLNWWHWESEGKAYCNNMAVHYKAAMEKLASAVRDEAADHGGDGAARSASGRGGRGARAGMAAEERRGPPCLPHAPVEKVRDHRPLPCGISRARRARRAHHGGRRELRGLSDTRKRNGKHRLPFRFIFRLSADSCPRRALR